MIAHAGASREQTPRSRPAPSATGARRGAPEPTGAGGRRWRGGRAKGRWGGGRQGRQGLADDGAVGARQAMGDGRWRGPPWGDRRRTAGPTGRRVAGSWRPMGSFWPISLRFTLPKKAAPALTHLFEPIFPGQKLLRENNVAQTPKPMRKPWRNWPQIRKFRTWPPVARLSTANQTTRSPRRRPSPDNAAPSSAPPSCHRAPPSALAAFRRAPPRRAAGGRRRWRHRCCRGSDPPPPGPRSRRAAWSSSAAR